MKMIRMCLDPRVVAVVAAAAVAVYVWAPNLFAAALPVLFVAVCPLSMALMMRMMMSRDNRQDERPDASPVAGDRRPEQVGNL